MQILRVWTICKLADWTSRGEKLVSLRYCRNTWEVRSLQMVWSLSTYTVCSALNKNLVTKYLKHGSSEVKKKSAWIYCRRTLQTILKKKTNPREFTFGQHPSIMQSMSRCKYRRNVGIRYGERNMYNFVRWKVPLHHELRGSRSQQVAELRLVKRLYTYTHEYLRMMKNEKETERRRERGGGRVNTKVEEKVSES